MGQARCDDEVETLLRRSALVEEVGCAEGLAPPEVLPAIALAGRRGLDHRLGRVRLPGEGDLAAPCLRRGQRLGDGQVGRVAAALAAAFPPYETPPGPWPSRARSRRRCSTRTR